MTQARNPEDRFWEKVNKDGPIHPYNPELGACWVWTSFRNRQGYGKFRFDSDMHLAHRVAWAMKHGSIPHGYFVCHHCDNPACVRESHLFIGTPAENVADMRAKGRAKDPRGEQINSAKLTSLDVLNVRRQHAAGVSARALGRAYGVAHGAILAAVRRQTWKEVA